MLSQQPDVTFPLYDEIVATNSRPLELRSGMYYVGITAINDAGMTQATNYAFSLVVDVPDSDQLIFVSLYSSRF